MLLHVTIWASAKMTVVDFISELLRNPLSLGLANCGVPFSSLDGMKSPCHDLTPTLVLKLSISLLLHIPSSSKLYIGRNAPHDLQFVSDFESRLLSPDLDCWATPKTPQRMTSLRRPRGRSLCFRTSSWRSRSCPN